MSSYLFPMYISASKQFDKIIVWEQRTDRTDLNIRTFNAPYQCYVRIGDWKNCRSSLTQAVDDGDIESATVLKNFLGSGKAFIDTATTYLSMYNEPLYKLKFKTMKEMKAFTGNTPTNVRLYESDIPPELKVLSANYYQAELPILNVTFYDIEVAAMTRARDPNQVITVKSLLDQSVHEMSLKQFRSILSEEHAEYEYKERPLQPFRSIVNSPLLYDEFDHYSSTSNPEAPINAIAFYHTWKNEYVCYTVPPCTWKFEDCEKNFNWEIFKDINAKYRVVFCRTEAELLTNAVEEIQQSDVMSGWNSSMFDDPYFAQRVEIVLGEEWFKMLSFPKGKKPYYSEREIFYRMQKQVQFDGRITVDYLELFKKFTVEDRDSWSLESVSQDHLGERFKKLEYEGTLHSLYHENFSKFVRYNIRDTEILCELDKKYKFIQLANWMMHYSTCQMKHVLGTVRKAEMSVANFCWHELNLKVPDTHVLEEQGQAQGAYVLVPQKGLQTDLFLIDVTGLYPSCMKGINISPEKLVGQFVGNDADRVKIIACSDTSLTLTLTTGEKLTKLAKEWNEWLRKHKYSISGHGTVYNQDSPGIVPTILEEWFQKRKQAQNQSKIAKRKLEDLLNAAKSRKSN